MRHVHHHKPLFAAHRNHGFWLGGEDVLNGSDTFGFEVVGA
jgi:hypothetical protein